MVRYTRSALGSAECVTRLQVKGQWISLNTVRYWSAVPSVEPQKAATCTSVRFHVDGSAVILLEASRVISECEHFMNAHTTSWPHKNTVIINIFNSYLLGNVDPEE